MKKPDQTTLCASEVDQFAALVAEGIESWKKAGRLLVAAMERDPQFTKRLKTAHPDISHDMLAVFERIGRNQLSPLLLSNNSPGAREIARAPIEVQEKYLREPVPVAVWDNSKHETRLIPLTSLTKEMARWVFHAGGCRTPAEQIAYRKDVKERGKASAVAAAPVRTREVKRLGCYAATVARNGVVTLTPTKETYRSQQVKCERPAGSLKEFSAEILFFTHE